MTPAPPTDRQVSQLWALFVSVSTFGLTLVVNSISVATLALLAIFTNYITIMAAPAGNADPDVVEGDLGGLLVPAVPDPFPIANYPRAPVSAARERIHYSAALKDDDYEYRCVSPLD